MKLRTAAMAFLTLVGCWCASALFFAGLALFRPDLDVIAGANAMTAMFAFCAGTALAVEAADKRNL